MAEATIPVDLRDAGQVFACLGLMEAAESLLGPAEGGYVWSKDASRAEFTLAVASVDVNPVLAVVTFLTRAEARALNAPTLDAGGVAHTTDKWNVTTEAVDPTDPSAFPFAPPESPATLPVALIVGDQRLQIAHWGDDPVVMGRDNVKFWAGSGGYPGAALARDALCLVAGLTGSALDQAAADPFAFKAPQSSSFSFDWRRSYVPLDAGFSPNEHASMLMVGHPFVELLAALGLENARPKRVDKLAYRYAVSDARLPTMLARVVLGGVDLGFAVRRFAMQLKWPGKEGQARCIVDSREETQ